MIIHQPPPKRHTVLRVPGKVSGEDRKAMMEQTQKLKTVIIENTWLTRRYTDFGWGNGYVVLPVGHPLHGVEYENIDLDVHGGLTYSSLVEQSTIERLSELTPDDLGKWMIGFDTAHLGDGLDNWPKEAVQAEADSLMQKILELYPTANL